MLGFRFIKLPPTMHVIQYRKGRVVREGPGLAFFFYAPTTSIVAVPTGSSDAPFIFDESTADFQTVSIQGQATYRIVNAQGIAGLLNFTLDPATGGYLSDDPQKLAQRIINTIQVLTRQEVQRRPLRDVLRASDSIVAAVSAGLAASADLTALGLEILGFSILAIRPTPETARALEADAREQILRTADEAIYARRNSAVEQERAIRENELNTEIAVENKKRQIREAQMDAERAVQTKTHELADAEMAFKIEQEEKNRQLVALSAENARTEAEARAYGVAETMKALDGVDPQTLQVLAGMGMQPDRLVALAFQQIAGRADQIGQLNVSPELLRELLANKQ